jgi:hypothetical protein
MKLGCFAGSGALLQFLIILLHAENELFLKLAICLLVELRRAGAEAAIACSTSDVYTLRNAALIQPSYLD